MKENRDRPAWARLLSSQKQVGEDPKNSANILSVCTGLCTTSVISCRPALPAGSLIPFRAAFVLLVCTAGPVPFGWSPPRCRARHRGGDQPNGTGPAVQTSSTKAALNGIREPAGSAGLQLITEVVHNPVHTERMFAEFFGSSPTCFWLDSSLAQAGLSRFPFMGDGSGPISETLTYRVGEAGVQIRDDSGVRMAQGSAFEVLERRLSELRMPADPGLPFDFTTGYVGYMGYEMKADCGADATHCARTPDAMWIFADRSE